MNGSRTWLNSLRGALAIPAALACLLLPAGILADETKVSAEVDSTTVTKGDSITYTVTVEGEEIRQYSPPEDLSPNIKLANGPSVSRSMSIVNGQRTITGTIQYEYATTAVGPFHIGPMTLHFKSVKGVQTERIEGKVVEAQAEKIGNDPTAPILPARTGNANIDKQLKGVLFSLMEIPKKKCYVQEPIPVKTSILKDRNMRFELAPVGHVSEAGGKDFVNLTPPMQPNQQKRLPPPKTTTFGGAKMDKWEEDVSWLVPTRAGTLAVEGPVIRVQVVVGNPMDFFARRIDAELHVPSGEVEVLPLPAAPAGVALQAVGNLTPVATIDRQGTMDESELLTLRVKLSGKGFVEQLPIPELPEIDGLQVIDKKASDAQSDVTNGQLMGRKEFEYVLQATRPGSFSIPALAFAIFDPETGKQDVRKTQPLEIKVTPGKGGTQLLAAQTAATVPNVKNTGQVSALQSEINFIETTRLTRMEARRPFYSSWWFWVLNAAPLVLLTGYGLSEARRRSLARDPRAVARGAELRRAETAMKEAKRLAATGPREPFYAALAQGVLGYIAAEVGRPATGLTAEEGCRGLLALGRDGEVTGRLKKLLTKCDSIRYSPVEDSAEQRQLDLKGAEDLLAALGGAR